MVRGGAAHPAMGIWLCAKERNASGREQRRAWWARVARFDGRDGRCGRLLEACFAGGTAHLGERIRKRLRTGGKRDRPWAVAIQCSLS
jgi:hypothetical protein